MNGGGTSVWIMQDDDKYATKWYANNARRHAQLYVQRSKHGTDSMVISLGGIASQSPVSPHTVGAYFWPNVSICLYEVVLGSILCKLRSTK